MKRLFLNVPEGRIHALAWHGPPDAPTLVFAHATGMCAAPYAAFLIPFAQRFRVIAPDARGHGLTELPADAANPPADWNDWGTATADVIALLAALNLDPAHTILAGHSFGGSCAVQAAAHLSRAGTPPMAAWAIEPAFIPFGLAENYRAARAAGTPPNPMAERAAKRSGAFPSRAAMRAAYAGRGVFAAWPPAALDAYVTDGATEDADGARLNCTPAWEAATFRAVTTRLRESVEALACPFTLVHGTESSTVTQPDADAMAALGARVTRLDGAGHFAPVEEAERVRAVLA